MADRENVIKGLDLCTAGAMCEECPYKEEQDETYSGFCEQILKLDALELLQEQQAEIDRLKAEQTKWIPVSERLPEEHETIFAKLKGTDKWNSAMFEKMSDDVRVVEVFEDGTRRVFHSHTMDGKWDVERKNTVRKYAKVTHWMPNPELPKEGEQE